LRSKTIFYILGKYIGAIVANIGEETLI